MKTKFVIGLVALSLLTLSAAAESHNSQQQAIEKGTGMISPGSPFYGLEVAADDTAVSIGLSKAGNVAQERAAEAKKATENNNTRGAQRAAQNLENIAKKAKESDEEGITRAMSSMEDTIASAPNAEARQGMQTALDNMKEAGKQNENRDEQIQQPENTTDNQPSEQPDSQLGDTEDSSQNTADQQNQDNNTAETRPGT